VAGGGYSQLFDLLLASRDVNEQAALQLTGPGFGLVRDLGGLAAR